LPGSVTQPGETLALRLVRPFHCAFISPIRRTGLPNTNPTRCLGITIPIVTWSTPWTFPGARLQFFSVTPLIETGVVNTSYNASVYNPALFGQLAWSLGNGFGFSYALGAYFDIDQPVARSSTSLNQRFALSYTGSDWNLTANVIYGIQFASVTNQPQISPCPEPFSFNACNPDFINIDLTATKKFGNWELGLVAYGNTDLTRPIAGYQLESQFAVGAFFGYDFGPLTLQAYATTDVVQNNYGGRATRGWSRMIIPLWKPPALPQITKGSVREHRAVISKNTLPIHVAS
jgi:hypothetical protein